MNNWHCFRNIRLTNVSIINTKFINISISPAFFILSADQSFEVFPKHIGLAAISESFALIFTISLPLTNK